MSSVIHKIELSPLMVQSIMVPAGTEFLCVREQFNNVCLWYRCDLSKPAVSRNITLVQTGAPAPEDGKYIGTALLNGGAYVLHAFVEAV